MFLAKNDVRPFYAYVRISRRRIIMLLTRWDDQTAIHESLVGEARPSSQDVLDGVDQCFGLLYMAQ